MMKNLISAALVATSVMTAGCATATEPNYTVTLPMPAEADGMMAYIVDLDAGEKLDSVIVSSGMAKFSGTTEGSTLARMVIGGNRGPIFILEPGNITFDSVQDAHGTALNERLNSFGDASSKLVGEYRSLPKDSAGQVRGQQIIAEYNQLTDRTLQENSTNPLGLYLAIEKASEIATLADFNEFIKKYPAFAQSKRLGKLQQALETSEATSPGKMFRDFEVTYDGKTSRLSDYVGKGKYTLVDFWASWCGPCIRATATLKELYNKYADKGLDILGVAVWDEPANTLEAIEGHELPWPQIINAQSIPTDLYGIQGIPCIILFAPDGTIVSRGKQGQELIDDVDAAMATLSVE